MDARSSIVAMSRSFGPMYSGVRLSRASRTGPRRLLSWFPRGRFRYCSHTRAWPHPSGSLMLTMPYMACNDRVHSYTTSFSQSGVEPLDRGAGSHPARDTCATIRCLAPAREIEAPTQRVTLHDGFGGHRPPGVAAPARTRAFSRARPVAMPATKNEPTGHKAVCGRSVKTIQVWP